MPDWALWIVVILVLGVIMFVARKTFKSASNEKIDSRNITRGHSL
jgi:uncharacterized protein YneF (UPF0154 family)